MIVSKEEGLEFFSSQGIPDFGGGWESEKPTTCNKISFISEMIRLQWKRKVGKK